MTKEIIIKELIEKIEKEIKEKNTTENKVLIESGAGKDLLKNLRKGQSTSIEKIVQLAEYLNVSIDYLIGRTTEPTQQIINNSGEIGKAVQAQTYKKEIKIDESSIELLEQFKKLSFKNKAEIMIEIDKRLKGE